MVSAAARKECRGAHAVDDYERPADDPVAPLGRDDENWMKHTLWYSEGNRLDYKPVKLQAADGRIGAAEGAYLLKQQAHKETTMKRTFQIYRYDPDKDAKPYMQTIEIELDGHERMLLDALMKLKAQDPTLSFRRSCREGVCGSDAMNINGKNGLACLTNMLTLKGTIVLKPLPGLPVIRDLIVDMTQFFKQYNSIKPYLQSTTTSPPEKERLQSPEERDELNGLYECILCASCSTQLPELLVEPGQVRRPGRPAAGLSLHRRQPRRSHRRAPGQPGRPVPPVPLPHDHELRRRLPEGPEPDQGDRQDQGIDGAPRRLSR